MPRVAFCGVCQKVEKLLDPPEGVPMVDAVWRWREGSTIREEPILSDSTNTVAKVPAYDPLLEDYAGRHQHGMNDRDVVAAQHVWEVDMQTFLTMNAAEFVKDKMQMEQDALVTESNHYKEEALKCYNRHGNPDLSKKCIDFRDPKKRIGSGRMPPEHQIHICHFCPYTQASIATELRAKMGFYDTNVHLRMGPKAKAAFMKRKRKGK